MISVVISYCNNDFKFIEKNLGEVRKFAKDIIVCYCDYSFDGEQEDPSKILQMLEIAKGCNIVKIPYDLDKPDKYHHNLMRWYGIQNAKEDYVLFLDADEIIEGELFNEFLENYDYKYDVLSLECNWYFRDNRKAKKTEEAGVLCKKSICTEDYIFSNAERWEFLNRKNLKITMNFRYKDQILCHHYSWARTKEEMLKKVKSWGHKNERDWVGLIEEEFSREFNGTDFVHKYEYE